MEIPSGIHALLIGLLIAMIGMAFGMNVGYPINPARDFAPRVFAAMIGYGWEVFRYDELINVFFFFFLTIAIDDLYTNTSHIVWIAVSY